MSDTETGALLAAVNGLVPHYPDDAALILRHTLAALLGASRRHTLQNSRHMCRETGSH